MIKYFVKTQLYKESSYFGSQLKGTVCNDEEIKVGESLKQLVLMEVLVSLYSQYVCKYVFVLILSVGF